MQLTEDKAQETLAQGQELRELVYANDYLAAPITDSEGVTLKQSHKAETRPRSDQHILPPPPSAGGRSQQVASKYQLNSAFGRHRHMRPGRRDTAPQQRDPAAAKLKWHNRHKNPRVHPTCCSVHVQHSNKS